MALTSEGPLPDLRAIEIVTERVVLRSIRRHDTREIFEGFTPSVTRYMMPRAPDGIGDTEAFVNLALDALGKRTDLHLTIRRRSDEAFLGLCGLHARGEPELGIWLQEAAHGQGYGREAIAGLVAWTSANLSFERLIYPVDRRNVASIRIPESLGGRIIGERRERSESGLELDEVIYAIPRTDAQS